MDDTIQIYYAFAEAFEEDTLETVVEYLRRDFDVQYSRDEGLDASSSEVLGNLLEGNGTLCLDGSPMSATLFVNHTGYGPEPPNLELDFDEMYFRPDSLHDWDGEDVVEAVISVCEISTGLYGTLVQNGTSPQYVLGTDIVDWEFLNIGESNLSTDRSALLGNGINQIFWLQIVPPEIVERTDQERFESVPAWTVERLEDGAVSIVCHPSPAPAPEMEDEYSTEDVRDFFGFDVGL